MSKVVQSNVITSKHGDTLEVGHFHAAYGIVDVLTIGTTSSLGDGVYTIPCLMTSAMWQSGISVNLRFTKFGKIIYGQIPYTTVTITNSTLNTEITLTPKSVIPEFLNANNYQSIDDSAKVGRLFLAFSLGDDFNRGADIYILNTSSGSPLFSIIPDDITAVAGTHITIGTASFCYAGYI